MRKILLSLALLVSVTGCTFLQGLVNPNPNVVATMEASLAAADSAALAYVQLPKCGSKVANGSTICSDSGVVKNIGTYQGVAYTAIKTAEANETSSSIEAAQNALTAYQAIVNTLQH